MSETPKVEPFSEKKKVAISKAGFMPWLKKVGWLGFLFFLIKGLLWLIIPFMIAKGCMS